MRTIKASFAALAIFSLCHPAQACRPPNNLTDADIAAADSVFIGRIVGLKASGAPGEDGLRILEFEVIRTVRGKQLSNNVQVYGAGGTLGDFLSSIEEFTQRYGAEVEVGIVSSAHIQEKYSCTPMKITNGNGITTEKISCKYDLPFMFNYRDPGLIPLDRPWIVGTTCTVPYIFPADRTKLQIYKRPAAIP